MKRKSSFFLLFIVIASLGSLAQTPPSLDNGWKPYGSYEGSHLDTVNLMNGNLMLHAPLLPDAPQRGSVRLSNTLFVSSKDWQVICTTSSNGGDVCRWQKGGTGVNFQFTPALSVTRTLDSQFFGGEGNPIIAAFGYSIVTPDQATHPLHGVAGTTDSNGEATVFDSTDLSGYHVTLSNPDANGVLSHATIIDRAGNQYEGDFRNVPGCGRAPTNQMFSSPGNWQPDTVNDAPSGEQNCAQSAIASLVTDSNGNRINLPVFGATLLDTLGKGMALAMISGTTDFSGCVSSQPISFANLYQYQDPNGIARTIKLCAAEIPIQTDFEQTTTGGVPIAEAVTSSGLHFIPLVTAVLADGTRWTFDYDNYGEITHIGLPTGGSVNYVWTTISYVGCNDGSLSRVSRAVAARTISDGLGHSSTWQYHWGTASPGSLTNSVTDPLGNETVHVFSDQGFTAGVTAGCKFYETSTIQYQGPASANQVVQRVDTSYSASSIAADAGNSSLANVFATDIVTTLYPENKVKKVHRDPDPGLGPGLPGFGNVSAEYEYDWGQGQVGPLLHESHTVYQWQKNSSYLTAHLLDLPASKVVVSPTGSNPKSNCPLTVSTVGSCAAETDYTYDEVAYLTTPSPAISTQHVAPPNGVRGNPTTVSEWLSAGNSFISSHTKWYDTGEPYQKIDPLGHTTTLSYDPAYVGGYLTQTCSPQTGTVAHCVSAAYDFTTGVMTSFTDQNSLTSNFGYDLMFHLVSAQGPLDPNNNARPADTFQYSSSTAPTTFPMTVTHLKSITSSTSDSATVTYDGLARVIRTQHATPAGMATVDTTYDILGRTASVSNPYFTTSDATYGITQTVYDALDRPLLVQKPDGSYSTVAYQGNCTVTQDEAGKARRTCSDALGRLTEVEEPGDSSAPGATDAPTTPTSATAIVTISGAEQFITSPPVKCPRPPMPCDQQPDPPTYDSGSVSVTVNGHATSAPFGEGDNASSVAANLATAINNDAASPVSASVSGQQITLTARAAGQGGDYNVSFVTTDSAGFSPPSFTGLVSSFRLLGGADLNLFAHVYTTLYQYDVFGNLLCVEQHGNATGTGCAADPSADSTSPWRLRRFTYDSLSRLLTAHNPESGTIAYSYDNDGNLLTKTDARGVVTNFSPSDSPIDALHRVTKTTYSDGTPSVIFGYDVGCCAVDPKYGVGRVTYEMSGNTELVFVYDVLGHITGQADCPPSGIARGYCYGIGATYDLAGNQRSLVYPDGRAIGYNYNSGNQLNQVQLSSVNGTPNGFTYWTVADTNFLPTGQPTTISLGNGDSETQHFNKRLQLTEKTLAAGSLGTLADHVFNYGAQNNGNVQSVADQLNSAYTQTFSYDQLNRLLTANESRWGMSYVYDGWGNYLQQNQTGGTTYQHQYTAAVNNRLNGYTYDLAGNMLADGSHQYTYDGETRIKTVDSTVASYTYNPEGNRIRKDTGSGSTEYFYFGGKVIAELDQAGNWVDYIYVGGKRIARSDTNLVDIATWGTQCSGCAWGQFVSYSFANAGGLSGYVIRPGDKLYVAQYQNTGTSAGPGFGFTDGTFADAYNITDQDGQKWTADSFVNTWHYRGFDLTSLVGKTISSVYFETGPNTAAGSWRALYGNLVLESADGSVHPIYTRENSVWLGENAPTQMTGSYGIDQYASCVTCSGDVTTYYHDDQIGSSRLMTGVGGWPIWQGTFLPYGEEYNPQITTNHFKFTGKERDTESGLDYFGARYYSNGLGRFAGVDPALLRVDLLSKIISNPANLNGYQYANGEPITKTDLGGYLTIIVPGTHWSTSDWNENSQFYKQVSGSFGEKAMIFAWNGSIRGGQRAHAADNLAKLINSYKFAPGEKLNIVAHSHGGNVAFMASHHVNHKIDNLVALGTPDRDDSMPDMDNIFMLLDVWSPNDWVQTLGRMSPWNGATHAIPATAVEIATEASGHSDLYRNPDVWTNHVQAHISSGAGGGSGWGSPGSGSNSGGSGQGTTCKTKFASGPWHGC